MTDLFINNFNGEKIYTFLVNEKLCWIAKDIAKVLGYEEPSKAISNCIKVEDFETDTEYSILTKDKLKNLKSLMCSAHISGYKQIPKLTIFYEEGLYGFLSYSEMPLGVSFRKWLRREVLPYINRNSSITLNKNNDVYHSNNNKNNSEDNFKDNSLTYLDNSNFTNMKLAYDTMLIFKDLFDTIEIDATDKFIYLNSIIENLGFKTPVLKNLHK